MTTCTLFEWWLRRSGEGTLVSGVASGPLHLLLSCRKEGPRLLDSQLFFKKKQKDGYFNFKMLWLLSKKWQGIFYSLCWPGWTISHPWVAALDTTELCSSNADYFEFTQGAGCCHASELPLMLFSLPAVPSPLRHLPSHFYTLARVCRGQAFPNLPLYWTSNSPAGLLFSLLHVTLFIPQRRCYTGRQLAVTYIHLSR